MRQNKPKYQRGKDKNGGCSMAASLRRQNRSSFLEASSEPGLQGLQESKPADEGHRRDLDEDR